jgi:hypothetical protein
LPQLACERDGQAQTNFNGFIDGNNAGCCALRRGGQSYRQGWPQELLKNNSTPIRIMLALSRNNRTDLSLAASKLTRPT